jgi:hypothetical protein
MGLGTPEIPMHPDECAHHTSCRNADGDCATCFKEELAKVKKSYLGMCDSNGRLVSEVTKLKEQLDERVRENAEALERVQALGRQRKLDVEAQLVARLRIEELTAENLELKERLDYARDIARELSERD